MKIRLFIDGIPHDIDSTDPDLLARWLVEIFGRIPQIHPATIIEFRVSPSWLPDTGGQWRPDWLADTRVISQDMPVRSPRELAEALSKQIDQYERLRDGDDG